MISIESSAREQQMMRHQTRREKAKGKRQRQKAKGESNREEQ